MKKALVAFVAATLLASPAVASVKHHSKTAAHATHKTSVHKTAAKKSMKKASMSKPMAKKKTTSMKKK